MPGILQKEDDVKIQAATILGFRHLDQADSLPQDTLDYVEQYWSVTPQQLIDNTTVTLEQLQELGATNL